MKGISTLIVLTFLALASASKIKVPPKCTYLTKQANYAPNYDFVYPPFYMSPGQNETYQPLRCINPATVSETITKVCDWAAPPLVQFTLGDGYVHVQRQDASNRFAGTAVIHSTQKCNHNVPPQQTSYNSVPTITEMN